MNMKSYKSKKIVHAKRMNSTVWLEYRKEKTNYSDASINENLEGYVVVYNPCTTKEYWSWSPKEEFENGYDDIEFEGNFNRSPKK
jgi:hypothetical protein